MEAVKKIAIIGHGYVGKAVAYGFDTPHIEQCLIDPIYGTEVDSLAGKNMDAAFVCVPTPMGKNGKIDASIVVDVVAKLKHFDGIIAVKSSVTPDIMRQLAQNEKVVYNPEFLREKALWKILLMPPCWFWAVRRNIPPRYKRYMKNTAAANLARCII